MSSSRFIHPLFLIVFLALLSTAPRPARSELVHGFLKARPDVEWAGGIFFMVCGEAFDFSAQTIVRHDSAGADLCFFSPVNFSIRWKFLALAAGLQRVHPTSLEALLLAPEGGYGGGLLQIIPNGVYVVLTDDGFYAKFRVHEFGNGLLAGCCSITIEYYVQTDGTRNLDSSVLVHTSTWGRVKALYQ